MKNNERLIYYYELRVAKRAAHGSNTTLLELAKVWKDAFDAGKTKLIREKGSIAYRIADVKIDNKNSTLSMLIRRSDKNAEDAVYENHATGNLRHIPKSIDEGGSLAAHLIISLKPEKKDSDKYLMLLEGTVRIGHRIIQPLLNNIIREACKATPLLFSNPHPIGAIDEDGKVKQIAFVPHVELAGHLSHSTKTALASGTVNQLTFVKPASKPIIAAGSQKYYEPIEYSLSFDVKKVSGKGFLAAMSNMATRYKDDGFHEARIKFKDDNNKIVSLEFDLQNQTTLDFGYIKYYRIKNIKPPLAQSCSSIISHFHSLVLAELLKARKI